MFCLAYWFGFNMNKFAPESVGWLQIAKLPTTLFDKEDTWFERRVLEAIWERVVQPALKQERGTLVTRMG